MSWQCVRYEHCVLITAYHRRSQACTLVPSAWWKNEHTPINNLSLRITAWAWTVCLCVCINICVLLHFGVHCSPVWLLCDQCNKEGNSWLWSLFNISTTETWLGWQAPGRWTRSNVPSRRIRCLQLWEVSGNPLPSLSANLGKPCNFDYGNTVF